MSRLGRIARRTFLIGSAAVVGGVAFGIYKYREDPANPLTSAEGETVLNPYVIINADGVTIITPRAEMGQGTQSTLAALVAEELDVDWSQVRVMHGPPATAYYNQALLGAALPWIDYQVTDRGEAIREAVGKVGKFLNVQVTGGSTAMRDGYEKMRMAGATARETLKLAAAKRLGVDVAQLRTENGTVVATDGTALTYADLAVEAAAIEPPQVALRPRSDWRILGTALPRIDMVSKSTGTAEYGIDTRLPGMKFATVRMSPKRGGMVSFDLAEALLMDGVEQVLDLGDGIAVVATNTWLAFEAADAVKVVWADAPYSPTSDDHFAAIAAAFEGEPNGITRDDGDAGALVAGTEVTAEYRVPFLAHAAMEPMNATALYTSDALELWVGNQAPIMVQQKCAAAVGLPQDKVTVHTPVMGGAFGRRGEWDYSVLAARVAQGMPGVPVKVTWSREEDMRHDFYRPAAIGRFRGVLKDGAVTLLDARVAAPSVSQKAAARLFGTTPPGADRELLAGGGDQPYAIPNFRAAGYIAPVDVPIGFWRSVGASVNGFFFDSFVDEMAHAAAVDPVQFRLNLIRPAHEPSAKVLEAVAEMANWTGQKVPGRGRGVAFTYSFGTPVAQILDVVDENGTIRIDRMWIACDVGVALDPLNVQGQMMGGAIYGLSAAVHGQITFADGEAEQYNFPDYDSLRMHTAPAIDVRVLENNAHISGAGEPGTPPAAAALANALFDLTGTRARTLPLASQFNLLT